MTYKYDPSIATALTFCGIVRIYIYGEFGQTGVTTCFKCLTTLSDDEGPESSSNP